MEKLSMPLAMGYLKAVAMADSDLQSEVDIEIQTYGGGHRLVHMVPEIVVRNPPDILAFSVFGWNYNNFGRIAETFRQANPNGWCIFGGTHVSRQAERVFRMFPAVDVIVNGEGEKPFVSLLKAKLRGTSKHDLSSIRGVSYKEPDGKIKTTPDGERLKALDDIPSPFLTGAIPLVDHKGEFLYDVAMMETNRGCPYKCAFCYWGGAVGQKVSQFSRDRLREELELFGRLGVENIALCDANFGMLPSDRDFLDDLLAVRAKYGYPRNMVNSWAKNKSKVFYDIVETMHKARLSGDFTLALQTLSPQALKSSNRNNMKLNNFEDLCGWLNERGLASYVELIWGLPGETYESFLEGYDRAAQYTPRIATYTNMLLPNSDYDEKRAEYQFVTTRGDEYDFEYVLSHHTMSFADNVKMHHFLFWSRTLAEHLYFRNIWIPLRVLGGLSQSAVILSLDQWLAGRTEPLALGLLECKKEVVDNLDGSRIGRGLRYLYRHPGLADLFRQWWEEAVLPKVPSSLHGFFSELFEYDLATAPVHSETAAERGLEKADLYGQSHFTRRGLAFSYDFPALLAQCKRGIPQDAESLVEQFRLQAAKEFTLYCKTGFELVIDNHETVLQYVAKTEQELEEEAHLRQQGLLAETTQMHVVGLPDLSIRSGADSAGPRTPGISLRPGRTLASAS
jgi:radical SAM superfamily enzyme YgiQ (UPF0313 family)